jgi:lipopolysaccharide assembly outer membrane protein LptD (OstA)
MRMVRTSMKPHLPLLVFVVFIAVLPTAALFLPSKALCQDEFDVSADKLFGSQAGGREIVVLEGNVRIVHGATIALADSGLYERGRERLRLVGNVRVTDGDIEVRGEHCEYLRLERTVSFPRGIEASDSGTTLTADRGVYDLNSEVLRVEGNITYTESTGTGGTRVIRARRATYFRSTGFIDAAGDVYVEDTGQGSVLRAGAITYDNNKGFGIARLDPRLEITPGEGREALSVESDSMELYAEERQAVAIGNVNILHGDTEGSAGRAIFADAENRAVLMDGPSLLEGRSSLSGETITIFTTDGEISGVLVSGAAHSIYHPPGDDRSELTGQSIEMAFAEGELSEMTITGDARAVFHPSGAAGSEMPDTTSMAPETDAAGPGAIDAGADSTLAGPATVDSAGVDSTLAGPRGGPLMNEVSGETIVVVFEAGEARSANVTGGVEGLYRLESETGGAERVTYRSDNLLYDVENTMMHLEGDAGIEYMGMRLNSESIEYDARTYNLFATRQPVLWEGDEKITGTTMTYNLKTKRGSVETGRTAYEGGLYTGELIRKTGERSLNVSGGTYTTCNHLDPHYSFTSSKMKVIVDDKVVARPVILRIRGMPFLALPYFMFPIKRGRHSGILIPRVEFGFDQDQGRFVRNLGYYWAPNDYFDGTLWGDYYESSRWIINMQTRYRKRYLLSGQFDGSFTKEVNTGDQRWDFEGRHTQQIGQEGRLIINADFVSDEEYRQDTSDNLEKQLRRQLESDISYSNKWESMSLTVAAERRENLDTDVVNQSLPRLRLLLNKITLATPSSDASIHRGTYLSGSLSGTSTLNQTGDDERTQQQARLNANLNSDFKFQGRSQSIRSNTVITSVRKDSDEWCRGCEGGMWTNSAVGNTTNLIAKFLPFGWLNMDPSLTLSLAVYDDDKLGNRFPVRFMYWGGFSSNASIFRTFFPRLGPLKALRHVMTPRASFSYRPDFSKYQGRFYSMPGISGEVGESSILNLSMENRLQARLAIGDEVKKVNNLASLTTSTTYNFLYRDKGLTTPWSDIRNNLRIYPASFLELDLSTVNDPHDLDFESLDFQTRLQYTGGRPLFPGFMEVALEEAPLVAEEGVNKESQTPPTANPWHFNLIYRFSKGFDGADDNSWVDLQTGFNFTSNWRVEYGSRFDISGNETVYQEFSLYRDLHCWEARFVRRYSQGSWQYFFRVNIKALPDIYAERGLRALYRKY